HGADRVRPGPARRRPLPRGPAAARHRVARPPRRDRRGDRAGTGADSGRLALGRDDLRGAPAALRPHVGGTLLVPAVDPGSRPQRPVRAAQGRRVRGRGRRPDRDRHAARVRRRLRLDRIPAAVADQPFDGDLRRLPRRPGRVYLGCMGRRRLIMRSVRGGGDGARGKPILYFPARHDRWLVQTGDGWSAHVAGAIGVSTDAQASWWGGRGVGTVPHGLIAAFHGDTVAAAHEYAERFADEMNVTVLVDFENDSVRTSLEVADALGDKLWGVGLGTSA